MQGSDLSGGDVEMMVERLGRLPDAPMVMPKQRLELSPGTRLSGWIGRMAGRPVTAGDVRRSGR